MKVFIYRLCFPLLRLFPQKQWNPLYYCIFIHYSNATIDSPPMPTELFHFHCCQSKYPIISVHCNLSNRSDFSSSSLPQTEMALPNWDHSSLGPPTITTIWPQRAQSTSLHWRGPGPSKASRTESTTTATTMARSRMGTTTGRVMDSCTAPQGVCTRTWSSRQPRGRWPGRRESSGWGHMWVNWLICLSSSP